MLVSRTTRIIPTRAADDYGVLSVQNQFLLQSLPLRSYLTLAPLRSPTILRAIPGRELNSPFGC
jgi:hypothetical protein